MSVRWFGGPGQPPGICEIALESLSAQLDRLAEYGEHLAILGVSKSAEVALLMAADQSRIRLVIGLSPTCVVWANVGPGLDGRDHPDRSSWTRNGKPLSFVPYDRSWSPIQGQPPAFLSLYERSLAFYPDEARQATIPVERISGRVILGAGGDDQVWPSMSFANAIVARRAVHGLATTSITHPEAGHRLMFPGEPPIPAGDRIIARGGNPSADAELGRRVWEAIAEALRTSPAG
jgi:hypothetical protein